MWRPTKRDRKRPSRHSQTALNQLIYMAANEITVYVVRLAGKVQRPISQPLASEGRQCDGQIPRQSDARV
jgi:hypothetical protein